MRRVVAGLLLTAVLLLPGQPARGVVAPAYEVPDSLREWFDNQPPPVPPGSDLPPWSDTFEGLPRFRYNRVDGVLLGGRLRVQREGARERNADVELSYAFARSKGLYRVNATQSLRNDNRLHLDGEFYRLTRSFEYDTEIVGSLENTLASLLFRNDYRDYYEGAGGTLGARWRAGNGFGLRVSGRREDQHPLAAEADWGLFKQHRFRSNPAAEEGSLNALRVEILHESRRGGVEEVVPFLEIPRYRQGDVVHFVWETGGGDFDYGFIRVDARASWQLSYGQTLSGRLLAGRTIAGHLPAQAAFYAGGISTLRGHAYKAFTGDRVALANAEYAFALYRSFGGFVGADLGRAWDSATTSAPRFALDAAAGLQTLDGRVRLQWARDVRRSGAAPIFSVRTRAAF